MKKLLAFLFCFLFFVTNVYAVNIIYDGTLLNFDVAPVIENGRIMVPARTIFEQFGASVTYAPETGYINAVKGEKLIQLRVNIQEAYINGVYYFLEAPAIIDGGRTLVPLRFVSEALDCFVLWEQNTNTVNIMPLYEVINVVDGDTFTVNMNGVKEKIRLIGIDTPESVHPDAEKNTEAGKIASDYTSSLLSGKKVALEYDVQKRDMYGRILAYAYLDGVMINKKLLSEGYAVISTWPPNVKHVEEFVKLISHTDTGSTAAQEVTDDTNTQYVYIGTTGDKYHKENCRTLKNGAIKITLSEALAEGRIPCKICYPD
ncbi:MAG: stalk domain-containing protein [Bacillota bacterium]|nr:stalk domain-containing protein [Bacillota bacterium]